jgi:hypothetical protein
MRVSAVTALSLAVLLPFLASPAAAAAGWRSPVPAPVGRAFDLGPNPYAGGHHRGVDLLAPPGSAVRAACAGRVVVAGRVGVSGGVVTVLCGRWRVSVMPLAAIFVRRGSVVGAGARLGTLARSRDHAGLHMGVRRDGARFGYVDPLRFLRPARPPAAPPPLGRAPRARPHRLPPLLPLAPAPQVTARAIAATAPLAPWPTWAGLALVLAGLGLRWRRRRARALRVGAALHDRPTAAG